MKEWRWQIIEGDCEAVLPTLAPFDHVITDPPYSEHVHSKSRAGARKKPLADGNGHLTPCAIDRAVDFGFEHLRAETRKVVATECARLVRRWILAFSDVESVHLWQEDLTFAGLDYCRTGAWIKQGATPQFTGDRPAIGFEAIAIAHPKGKKRWNGGGSHGVWTHPIERAQYGDADVRVHPTQKPIALMLELVSLFSDPGDTILDPFAGGGTTGVACLRLGRRFIGIEKDPTFAALARERLTAEKRGQSLHSMRAGQEALFK